MEKVLYHTPDSILTEAFERIGLIGTEVTPLQWDSGLRAINYEIWEMANANPQLDFLWKRSIVSLNSDQTIYPLNSSVLDIKGVSLSNPFNVSGELDENGNLVNGSVVEEWKNLFLGRNVNQLSADQKIDFVFNSPQQILYFKVRGGDSNIYRDLTIKISVKSVITESDPFYTETFSLDILHHSDCYFCLQSPVVGKVYSFSVDQDIILQELSFLKVNQEFQDRPMGAGSITDYMGMAQKSLQNCVPSWYVLKKENVPLLFFPSMSNAYSCAYMLTFGLPFVEHILLNLIPILPIYALNYIIARVSVNLAKKFNPDRLSFLLNDSALLLQNLTQSQSSQAPVSFRFNFDNQ